MKGIVGGCQVARFTRAWIETSTYKLMASGMTVARFTRAWIETSKYSVDLNILQCRPLHAGVD